MNRFSVAQVTDSVAVVSEDSVKTEVIKKKWHQTNAFKTLAVPAVLVGLGGSTIGNQGLYSSRDAQRDLQRNFSGFHTFLDDYTVFSPALAVYALNLFGKEGKHRFKDRTLLLTMSGLLTWGIVSPIKYGTHILRPNGENYYSFPSGHTALAFTAAEFMRQEFRHRSPWYGVAAYSVATATGAMRMLNNRHWMSDVLAGAGIGILSVKLVYLVYPALGRVFKKKADVLLLPSYERGSMGFVMRIRS